MIKTHFVQISFNFQLEALTHVRSGGERRRTDLVTLFALFELVRQRSRFQSQFMMLDEVFDAIDTRGQANVKDVIAMLAEKVKKVFVVSHTGVTSGKKRMLIKIIYYLFVCLFENRIGRGGNFEVQHEENKIGSSGRNRSIGSSRINCIST